MATIADRHNPSWVLWPINHNTTAWRPISVPAILVVPHRRDPAGVPIDNSGVANVTMAIEGAPNEALVAGHDHVGLRHPDRELATAHVSISEMQNRLIDVSNIEFRRASDGATITYAAAISGVDSFIYITVTGVTDTLLWWADADYYDLSDLAIDTEILPPRHYNLIYSCDFYTRVLIDVGVDVQQDLACIDGTALSLALLRFGINHPGEVLQDAINLTPVPYLTNASRANDSTIDFYRPFAEVLQDIYDEYTLLGKANWMTAAPYGALPHLSALLGWDLPYFPQSLDPLRRAILRKTVELQKLKGSKKAIVELMNLFGYTVLINNLWYSADGAIFIGPGDQLPPQYKAQQIAFAEQCQIEPLLAAYNVNGFGTLTVPLLFRPQKIAGIDPFTAATDSGNITIDAYLVGIGSPAAVALDILVAAMAADPDAFAAGTSTTPSLDGFLEAIPIHTVLDNLTVNGYSQILLVNGNGSTAVLGGTPPLIPAGVSFDKAANTVAITFDGYIDFSTQLLYVFASYAKQEVTVPAILQDLRSNRFDIQIIDRGDGSVVDTDIVNFLLDFIDRVKAFHSILRSIRYRADMVDVYLVTDLGVGGNVTQRYNTDVGRLQVPPAFIPKIPADSCLALTPAMLGYRLNDLNYRSSLLTALAEEVAAWLGLAAHPPTPVDVCGYSYLGQDRTIAAPQDLQITTTAVPGTVHSTSSYQPIDPPPGNFVVAKTAARTPFCAPDNLTDYKYRGRVGDELYQQLTFAGNETVTLTPCNLGLGTGVYWLYPAKSKPVIYGVTAPPNSHERPSIFSGNTNVPGIQLFTQPQPQGQLLSASNALPLPLYNDSWLGRLYRAYGTADDFTLHFDNRHYLTDFRQSRQLALQRPEVHIEQPTLNFPGCRLPSLGRLRVDYITATWRAKPWDDQYSSGQTPTWLGATLSPNGQTLIYPSLPYKIIGNNLLPDITSLGVPQAAPSFFPASSVVHAVYSSQVAVNRPWLTQNQVVQRTTSVHVTTPLFRSARPSGGGWDDFCDGYPATTGNQNYNVSGLDRGIFSALYAALGIPAAGGPVVSLLFSLGSGISTGDKNVRLDCGCSSIAAPFASCSTGLRTDEEGVLDFSPDILEGDLQLVGTEIIGASSFSLDGSIPTLFELKVQ